jgi:hypothetical protein
VSKRILPLTLARIVNNWGDPHYLAQSFTFATVMEQCTNWLGSPVHVIRAEPSDMPASVRRVIKSED